MLRLGKKKLLLCQENRRDPNGIVEIPLENHSRHSKGMDSSALARFTWQERKHGHFPPSARAPGMPLVKNEVPVAVGIPGPPSSPDPHTQLLPEQD